jgi:hypothetical protein
VLGDHGGPGRGFLAVERGDEGDQLGVRLDLPRRRARRGAHAAAVVAGQRQDVTGGLGEDLGMAVIPGCGTRKPYPGPRRWLAR